MKDKIKNIENLNGYDVDDLLKNAIKNYGKGKEPLYRSIACLVNVLQIIYDECEKTGNKDIWEKILRTPHLGNIVPYVDRAFKVKNFRIEFYD